MTTEFDRLRLLWKGLPDSDDTFDFEDIRPGWHEGTAVVVPDIVRWARPVPLTFL